MSASEIKLNGETFYKKVQKIVKTWNQVILEDPSLKVQYGGRRLRSPSS
jgi:hypothetical protein